MARPPRSTDVVQTDDQALQALVDAGYTNVADLAHHGRVWTATAVNSAGIPVDVVVHGKDGRINEDTDEPEPPEPEPAA